MMILQTIKIFQGFRVLILKDEVPLEGKKCAFKNIIVLIGA